MAAQRSQPRRVASPRPTLREPVPRTQSRTADARRRRHAENPAPALHLHPAQLPQPQQAFAQPQQHITTHTATTPHISSHAHIYLSSHRPSPARARAEHTPAQTPLHSNHHPRPHSTHTSTRARLHTHIHTHARAFPGRHCARSRLAALASEPLVADHSKNLPLCSVCCPHVHTHGTRGGGGGMRVMAWSTVLLCRDTSACGEAALCPSTVARRKSAATKPRGYKAPQHRLNLLLPHNTPSERDA